MAPICALDSLLKQELNIRFASDHPQRRVRAVNFLVVVVVVVVAAAAATAALQPRHEEQDTQHAAPARHGRHPGAGRIHS